MESEDKTLVSFGGSKEVLLYPGIVNVTMLLAVSSTCVVLGVLLS